ncbi:transporter substrate-binding domain-containing protein [Suttonella ornithocola]|uniref:Sulfate starvation-induced protein 7 n=1 Tax=Suttonella ornithocola TaxID=279832 RepID=A0A380MQ15_9GAMM|nr:transporter substrate-binding domain-containing protein [Suttonella ornithocola]SUO94412.1 Sulfate starvation-induced protein 7 [Suttonella ornithocola]
MKKYWILFFSAMLAFNTNAIAQTQDKTYVVGTVSSAPPFMITGDNRQADGFSTDILKAIAEKEHLKLSFVITKWEGRLEKLDNGEHDILSTVIVTPDRKAKYDLTIPYADSRFMGLLKENPQNTPSRYSNFAEAVDRSQTFITEAGAATEPLLKNIVEKKGSGEAMLTGSTFLTVKAVATGQADMGYSVGKAYQYYINIHPVGKEQHLYGVTDPDSPTIEFTFGLKKGRNDNLLNTLNKGIQEIKADGTYDAIYKKWFGEG